MPTLENAGTPVMLDDTLQAGLLSGIRGNHKEYAAFERQEGVEKPTYVRVCTAKEKKKLKKLVHALHAVVSIVVKAPNGEELYHLFFIRS